MLPINHPSAIYSERYIQPQSKLSDASKFPKKNLLLLQHDLSIFAHQHGQSYLDQTKKIIQCKIENLEGRTKGICNFLRYLFSFSLRLRDRTAKIQKAENLKQLVSYIDTIYSSTPKTASPQSQESNRQPSFKPASVSPPAPSSLRPSPPPRIQSAPVLPSHSMSPIPSPPRGSEPPPPPPFNLSISAPASSSSGPPPPPPPPPPNGLNVPRLKRFTGLPEKEYVLTRTTGEVSEAEEYVKAMNSALEPIKHALDEEERITQALADCRRQLRDVQHHLPKYRMNLEALNGPEGYVDLPFVFGKGAFQVRFYSESEFIRINAEREQFNTEQSRKADKLGPISDKFRKEQAIAYFNHAMTSTEQACHPIREKIAELEAELREVQAQTNNEIPFEEFAKLYKIYADQAARCERAIKNARQPLRLGGLRNTSISQTSPAILVVSSASSSSSKDCTNRQPVDEIRDQTFLLSLRGNDEDFYKYIGEMPSGN